MDWCLRLVRRGQWTAELRRALESHPGRNTANWLTHNGLAHWLALLDDDAAWLERLFDFMGREGYDLGAANCHGETPAHIVARRFPPKDARKLWDVLQRHGASLHALDNWELVTDAPDAPGRTQTHHVAKRVGRGTKRSRATRSPFSF